MCQGNERTWLTFRDLTIANCMLIFILEFIHGCIADFEYKAYLPGEN